MTHIMRGYAWKYFGTYGKLADLKKTRKDDGLLFARYGSPVQCGDAFSAGVTHQRSEHVIGGTVVECEVKQMPDDKQVGLWFIT